MAADQAPLSRHLPTSAFAIARGAVGVASLFLPMQTAALFGINTTDSARIMLRLFGARELVLGSFLWQAQSRAIGAGGKDAQFHRSTLEQVLWAGVMIDSIDVVSSAVCVAERNMGQRAMWLVGGGAVVFAALGGIGLMDLQ